MASKVEFLIDVLRALADNSKPSDFLEDFNDEAGICEFMFYITDGSYDICSELDRFSKSWDFYSGEGIYPIPAPDEFEYHHFDPGLTPQHHAFHILAHWGGEYGELRREYCGFLANQLEEHYG